MRDKTTDQDTSAGVNSTRWAPWILAILLVGLWAIDGASAQPPAYGGYYPTGGSDFGSRHATPYSQRGSGRYGGSHWRGGASYRYPMQTQWLQRPYPYHLDYYKVRYGGSYAPYFGNLYGPPTYLGPGYYGGAYYY